MTYSPRDIIDRFNKTQEEKITLKFLRDRTGARYMACGKCNMIFDLKSLNSALPHKHGESGYQGTPLLESAK